VRDYPEASFVEAIAGPDARRYGEAGTSAPRTISFR